MNLGYGAFLIYERGKTCNEPVGQGLAVNALYYALLGERVTLQELTAYSFRELAFQAVADETASKCCAAAFIAQDISQ